MADTELLPCPFCGGDAQTDFIEGESYLIECYACRAETGIKDSEEDAIAAWNRRAPLASRPAEVDDEGMFSKDWKSGYSVGFEAAKRLFNGRDSNSPEIEGIANLGRAATEMSELKRRFLETHERQRREANEFPLHTTNKEK